MSNNPSAALDLKITRTLEHPPEEVFRALTDPDLYGLWMGPEGSSTEIRELDLREGGRLAITVAIPNGPTVAISGTYVEIAPPSKLVHTWLVDGDPTETIVTFELRAKGSGTELELTHEGFVDESDRGQNKAGWGHQLDRLDAALAKSKTE